MSKNKYPYQNRFKVYLQKRELSKITINEYDKTLIDLFNYLINFNDSFSKNQSTENIFDRDIEDYLSMLLKKREINNNTYNKILSQINVYFKYLFQNKINPNYPTLNIKGKDKKLNSSISIKWLLSLNEILQNEKLHPYTKMTLFLISEGYKPSEFLMPNFYKIIPQTNQAKLNYFKKEYDDFIEPIQNRMNSKDLFLKQRFSNDIHLTLPGLHKYLKNDQTILDINLSPNNLYQSFVVYFIEKNHNLSNNELSTRLNLDPASIKYYRNLIPK
ncbi:site-specific integrase [Lactobacillus sp. S2-2]|uniref:site-specific integrase n=1 Tax=Lactobacillus sp. S2-2 TaxID=2692917 RepID=UPI001F00017C|nr:site-specific integrase [Lactobacillus sp. S2-2]MCF6515024.1 site-specific integrase [Lactobacillus sp. S2-2]